MKTREIFEQIRSRKKSPFSLRVQMVLTVLLELLVCAGLTFVIDTVARTLKSDWSMPVLAELVIVSLIVGTLATVFVSKLFFNPIKKLRCAMDRVADGDFSVRLDPKDSASGEIQALYAGFNLMTHELSATEVLQSDFVSNVSHELKTPLNAIEGYATLLQSTEHVDEPEREYVEKILFNTRRLSVLVGNVLLLSRLENRVAEPPGTCYRLDEQIRQSIVLLENEWENKEIEPDVDMDDISYTGPENLMHHVWYNLIGNAVKFSPVGGTVRIRLSRVSEHICFVIEDEGPGISEEAKRHVFDKFYQEDTSHKQEGNGLGLSLVKNIVSIAGGELAVENRSEGGCRFTIILKDQQDTSECK